MFHKAGARTYLFRHIYRSSFCYCFAANFNPPLEGRYSIFNEVLYVARKPPESHKIIEEQRISSQKWLVHNRKRSSKEMEDLSQQDTAKNALCGMNASEQSRMPTEPPGSRMQNRGLQVPLYLLLNRIWVDLYNGIKL